jgi:hypothetical protein
MHISRDQNAGRSQNIKTSNSSFERVVELKYFGTILKNQNSVQGEIKSRPNNGSARSHSMKNLLSSRLMSKNIKINIYRTIVLSLV